MSESLKSTSLMSSNTDSVVRTISDYLSERTGFHTKFINDISWQERESLLDANKIEIAWICGLPYILRANQAASSIELLAAPVMQGDRYRNQPIYYSDIVVHRDSHFQTFADLRGTSWADNESGSHSGYNLIRYHLATLSNNLSYFSEMIESGSHLASLQMILERKIDASAIDSIVLEVELRRSPSLSTNLRIIKTLGPSPVPPLVIKRSLSKETKIYLRELLIHMHEEPDGQTILSHLKLARFVQVEDTDYDVIRYMTQKVKLAGLSFKNSRGIL
jgi:phosphonate transport system substrate-binding protein